jgi:glutaconyl-CoA/methylmalonyl-CoA decarboxylase subunit gamma
MEDITVNVNGKEYNVKVEETEAGKILVHCDGDVYEVESKSQQDIFEKLKKKETSDSGSGVIASPLPGTIYEVNVKEGQEVKEGQSLIKLIAMKMENEITSPKAGTVKEVKVKKNDNVNKGDVLIVIS